MSEDSKPLNTKFLRVDVSGKDKVRWEKFRNKLLDKVNELLDTVVDTQSQTTVGDEMKNVSAALFDYAKAQLARPSLENEKISAEVQKLYSEITEIHARARNSNAEAAIKEAQAEQMRFENSAKKMRLLLGAAKAVMIGQEGDEAIIFSRQIDALFEVFKDLTESAGSIE